ncbi:branched-chain amino acid transport system permease protein [Thermoflexus hugenholtzii JAD2]|uniref:Branched-chain amino acid transport system permease protein n=2 Tax=Thermoflexus TaxID=1495649 RepID=A0A212PXP9_9CHLR|nr:branched-chain amino acid transport system permease protein [Thermoflexus hugenholtzii JAD2]
MGKQSGSEMKILPGRRVEIWLGRSLGGLLLLGLYLLIERGGSAYLQRLTILFLINVMLVVSLNLFTGFTGVFSLGHIGFMALGAYASAILTMPVAMKAVNLPDLPLPLASIALPFLPALLLGGLTTMIIALLIGIPILRLSGHFVAVATLGFLIITRVILINAEGFTRGTRTFTGVPPYTTLGWTALWALFNVYVAWRLKHSTLGLQLLAARDDPWGARGVGVAIGRVRLIAFGISAFFTGVAGGLWAHFLTAFSPNAFYFSKTFEIIVMMIVGGMGSVTGSVLGTLLVMSVTELLRNLEPGVAVGSFTLGPLYGLSQIGLAVLLILLTAFRRQGLLGDREFRLEATIERLGDWVRKARFSIKAPSAREADPLINELISKLSKR